MYNLSPYKCDCYQCYEGFSRLDSSEISTCIFSYLKELDKKIVEQVFLFSDSCSVQNKKSAIVLHFVTNNVKHVPLKFVELYYQHFEEDSVHSAVNNVLTASWDIFVPLQEIASIIRLAHKENPCQVHCLFLDVMGQAKQL